MLVVSDQSAVLDMSWFEKNFIGQFTTELIARTRFITHFFSLINATVKLMSARLAAETCVKHCTFLSFRLANPKWSRRGNNKNLIISFRLVVLTVCLSIAYPRKNELSQLCKREQAENIDSFTVWVNNNCTKPLSATNQDGGVRKQLWSDQ